MTNPNETHREHSDPVIDAVHAARQRISARFGYDSSKLVAHYIERQRENADRLIPAPETDRTDRSAA